MHSTHPAPPPPRDTAFALYPPLAPAPYSSIPKPTADTGAFMAIDVGIIMGSQSDWPTMKEAALLLDAFGIPYEAKIVSAHRTPDRLWTYGKTAVDRGLKVIIAGAGGAAHLPGMMASKTRVPVIGVPVQTKALSGVDSLYSILQMPRGYPVATMAIGAAGAANAALMAAGILALNDPALAARLEAWRDALSASIPDEPKDD